MKYRGRLAKLLFLSLVLVSASLPFLEQNLTCQNNLVADGGNSPGTYEPDPEDRRRGDDHGGPYNEPGSDNDRRGGDDHGGPYNEPGSDGGPYLNS